MTSVFLAVDKQIDEEPIVIELDDFPKLTHSDAVSDVEEADQLIFIVENTAVTETLNEAPINQNAAKQFRLENVS